jgi:hypothetical protein
MSLPDISWKIVMSKKDTGARIQPHFQKLWKTGTLLGLRKRDLGQLEDAGSQLIRFFSENKEYSGIRYAIKEQKVLYREGVNIALGLTRQAMTKSWYKRCEDWSWPVALNKFIPLLNHENQLMQRFAISVLNFTTIIQLEAVKDISTIMDPSKGAEGVNSIAASFGKFLSDSKFSLRTRVQFTKEVIANNADPGINGHLHSTSKAGISGPSSATVGWQTLGIKPELEGLLRRFDNYFRTDHWSKYFNSAKDQFSDWGDPCLFKGKKNLRGKFVKGFTIDRRAKKDFENFQGKISFLPAPNGKTRMVAIPNYWIQETFQMLHRTIYSVLGECAQDGTYAQETQFDRVNAAAEKGPVWSFDLTAATDRFPIDFQIMVLNNLKAGLGTLWGEINRSLDFRYGKGIPIRYTVGQPMGLYGSWAVFALSHHYLIQFAAKRARYKGIFEDYAVLGDDVAIWHEKVALEYKRLLEKFDVDISDLKSFVPEERDNGGPCCAEFAKRITMKGQEMTPISLEMNSEAWDNPIMMANLLYWLKTRGYRSVEQTPMSRILRLHDIRDIDNRNKFVYQLWVNSLVTESPIQGIHNCFPDNLKEEWSKLSQIDVYNFRVKLSLLDIECDKLSPKAILSDRARLDKAWETHTQGKEKNIRSDYYLRMMRKRQQLGFLALWLRLCKMQGLDSSSKFKLLNSEGAKELGVKSMITAFQKFEYLPEVSFESLQLGILDRTPHSKLRALYIVKLSKFIMKSYIPEATWRCTELTPNIELSNMTWPTSGPMS